MTKTTTPTSKINVRRPPRSLRTILMMWLLMFSIVPLAFLTGYSLVKYEEAIDQELAQRLSGNQREIDSIFQEFQKTLLARNSAHAHDRTLVYYLSTNEIDAARDLSARWLKGAGAIANRLSIFSRDGRLNVSLYVDGKGNVQRHAKLEGRDVYLSNDFLKLASTHDQLAVVDFNRENGLDLVAFAKILSSSGALVGYIEEVLNVNTEFMTNLKNRMNIEVAFASQDGMKTIASHDDLTHYRAGFFSDHLSGKRPQLFDLNIRGVPYGFMVEKIPWGEQHFLLAIGASKRAANEVLRNVNYAFFSVVGTIILLLIVLSFVLSKVLLQPLNQLVDLVQNTDLNQAPAPERPGFYSDTELGILSSAFHEMVQRAYDSQNEMKENIKKLESANQEIRETQAKLVHAAKMASLGQLVAGVAHELNNPISFIYSNMAHLRDYSQRLIDLVNMADSSAPNFRTAKEEKEFDFLVQDMPKLIRSCEEGARRTRDIVIGLRNFSRLDEAKLKEVDIHEGIESTLALLQGEFKSRINIVRNFSKLPPVLCYPSQLNQVFMNILTNAIQAIPENGEIKIATRTVSAGVVEVSIRDNGMGMPDEVAQKIFDPFFTTKDVNEGTGLGMSIAYGVVTKHGGTISVHSKVGSGTEFVIQLPVRASR